MELSLAENALMTYVDPKTGKMPYRSNQQSAVSGQQKINGLAQNYPKGYKATIEAPTPDGNGRIDVLLEKDNEKIACEVSVTTDEAHEIENIKKCLSSGYSEVMVCAEDQRKLEKIKKLASDQIETKFQSNILFFTPEELMSYFTGKGTKEVFEEKKIKGYKVKVTHPGYDEPEKVKKRQAVAEVILKSFKRLKNK